MPAFSKRHRRALADDRLSPRLAPTARGRIRRLFERYNRSYTAVTEQNWNYETDTLEDLGGELRDLYGADHLSGDGPHGFSIAGFIADAPAECIFDALELFAAHEEALGFAAALNEILAEEEAAWRMLDSEMVLLDDAFARSELAARADDSIRGAGFAGALSELRRARNHVVDGDGRDAVHSAGSAFESVMMAMLGSDRAKAAKLIAGLSRGGYLDDLPRELRERFSKQVLGAMPWMRNELGGHGQGGDTIEIPPAYAQLAIDLAAAFSHFLITLKIARDDDPLGAENEGDVVSSSAAEAPVVFDLAPDFSVAPGSEDDIPF